MLSILQPLARAGAKPAHLANLLRVWLSGESLEASSMPAYRPLPAAVADLVPEWVAGLERLVTLAARYPAADGGERLLLRLEDEKQVESVLLPRDGLCVSTQVGCAVGCIFCMTGRGGLERGLSAAEILAQVVLGRRLRRVRRVVFMGMGEPLHNLDEVVVAMNHLGFEGRVGHKDLVFSTVGEPSVFERLARGVVKPAIALSLHSTDPARRRSLLPHAPRVEPRELLEAALAYAERFGHPLQLQWTLLAGINDGDDELERLIAWLEGRHAVVDFIRFNPTEGSDFTPTSRERTPQMTRKLHAARIIAKLRRSVAGEVGGACGQLHTALAPLIGPDPPEEGPPST